MKKNWPLEPIGTLCQLMNGRAFKPSEWAKHGLPIVRIQNLNDETKPYNYCDGEVRTRHLIEAGDVLLSWSGTPGTSFGCFVWNRGRAALNQHIFKVVVDTKRVLKEFFVHAVNSRLAEMISLAHGGVGLRHITKGKLERIELPVPSLPEQRAVVEVIRECLERVREIEDLQAGTRAEAAALFASFLGDIERRTTCPLVPLGELIESRNGRSVRSTGYGGNGYVLALSAVRNVALDFSMRKHVVLDAKTVRTFEVEREDVFVSRSNTRDLVGLSAVAVDEPEGSTIFPDLLIRLRPVDTRVLPRFLAYALRFPTVRSQIRARARGTSQSMVKISAASLKEVVIPLPSRSEQEAMLEALDEASKATCLLERTLGSAGSHGLAQAVLRNVFVGQL